MKMEWNRDKHVNLPLINFDISLPYLIFALIIYFNKLLP